MHRPRSAHQAANIMGRRRRKEANDEGLMTIDCGHRPMRSVVEAFVVVPPKVLGSSRLRRVNYP